MQVCKALFRMLQILAQAATLRKPGCEKPDKQDRNIVDPYDLQNARAGLLSCGGKDIAVRRQHRERGESNGANYRQDKRLGLPKKESRNADKHNIKRDVWGNYVPGLQHQPGYPDHVEGELSPNLPKQCGGEP